METVKIEFENCYGLKKLTSEFSFINKSVYAIYSPNGTMKTSFAKTFMDYSKGRESKDEIFSDRETKRIILDENSVAVEPENIFVIEPYNESFESDKLSTLLVNRDLKDEYDLIHKNINLAKDELVKKLAALTGLRKGNEEELSETFTHSKKEFFKSLIRVKAEVLDKELDVFSDIKYKNIFNSKVLNFLATGDFKDKILEYINTYDELVENSTYFKKGVFNHNNAALIAKNLKDNGFFKANHSVNLNSKKGKSEIKGEAELEQLINDEKESILNNPALEKAFNEIDLKLKANKELRDFREYLLQNPKILPELSNIELFKQKLWVSYLKTNLDSYIRLEEEYSKGKEDIEKIITEAKKEETDWRNVIDIFNDRFLVPFKLSVENQDDVILKSEGPNIKFIFEDQEEQKKVERTDLLRVLSNGEKRALYILNIIFEVEARIKSNQKTLFIVDDIADSFDYKNKYAIIAYLKDIADHGLFKLIMLSHNFDFFRTVSSRLDMNRENKLHTVRKLNEVVLKEEKYQNNPFLYWKRHLASNNSFVIACIPFVRNISEFNGDEASNDKLTSLLHIKNDTPSILVSELEGIYKDVLNDIDEITIPNHQHTVLSLIFQTAAEIAQSGIDVMELEEKIVLAIAIRLKAEQHMIDSINDSSFVEGIASNQTYKLFERYCEQFPSFVENISILSEVNLMTPENIHVNSFMYEPLLDMSNGSLVRLYNKTLAFELVS